MTGSLRYLGTRAAFEGLDTIPAPSDPIVVEMSSDEVTAICPVTGQPDQYTVQVVYHPQDRCIESKSLKLFFQTLRNEGVFCEELAVRIRQTIASALGTDRVYVRVTQKSRGGIAISAVADRDSRLGTDEEDACLA